MIALEQTILAQYANSPTLRALLEAFNAAIDPTADLELFQRQVWNWETAAGYGLDLWGRIVGVTRFITLPGTMDLWGFDEGLGEPFGSAPFWNGSGTSTIFALSDAAFLVLIKAKALTNLSGCSAPDINRVLQQLLGAVGRCYCLDGQNMTGRLAAEFELDPVTLTILIQSGVLPRPAGVQLTLLNGYNPSTGTYSAAYVLP